MFFAMSGFFFSQKLYGENGKGKGKKTLLRQIKLYLLWSLLFFPINIWGELHIYHHQGKEILFSLCQGWFLIGENYGSWPLWYLLASIVGMTIIMLLNKLGLSKIQIVVYAFVVYAIGMILIRIPDFNMVDKIINLLRYFHGNRNGLFYGWAFLSVGLLDEFHIKGILLYALLTVLLLLGCYINPTLIVLPLSILCLQILLPLKLSGETELYVWMRKLSTLNYFSHMFFVFLISDLLRWFVSGIELFLVVSPLTTLFSCFVIMIKKNRQVLNRIAKR